MKERKSVARAVDLGASFLFVGLACGISFIALHQFGPKVPGYAFLFLLAIMASAVRGYLAGITASLLSVFVAPFVFLPYVRPAPPDPVRVAMTLLISILISAVVAVRKRSEHALRLNNEELDLRVRQRTAELEKSNQELARRDRELTLTRSYLSDVLDSVSESFLILDRDFRFTYVNRWILDSIGRTNEEVVGKLIWDVFPAAAKTEFYPQYHRVMEERVKARFEVHYPESGRWLEVTAHPTDPGLAAFVSDVTQRKQDEAAIARLASIVESSSDAIVSKDLNGTILSWNSGAQRIYGFTPEDAIGKSMEMVLPADRMWEESRILERLRRGEQVDHFETVRVRKDGTHIDVSLTVSPVRSRDGVIIGASHVARDITEQKTFNTKIRQVQKLESLGVLAGGIAHDFNNLLVGILGNASLAMENCLPQNSAFLDEIMKAGQRAADLTSQLLAYAGKGRFFIQLIDISALVREISQLIQTSISASVQLKLDLADDLPPVEADSGQIQQIIMNLVINGAEAVGSDKPGVVTVETRAIHADEQSLASSLGGHDLKPGEYVLLQVSDTGCGMDKATQARIFDPFFTTKFTGRGLGLSAVLGIVGSHKGVLKVESEPGRGTTFRVLLPAADGGPAQPRVADVTVDLRGVGSILVVDDEEMVRKVARKTLERFGYSVSEAMDGQKAIELFAAARSQIDLVLLDLTMPVMGGEETLERLRKIRSDIPVILSSGFSESEALRRFEGKGIAGFVQKPYKAVQLAEKVKLALGSRV